MTATESKKRIAWRDVLESSRFGLPLAWNSNPRLCLGLLLFSTASALAGPLLILVLGVSVSEIQASLEATNPDPGGLTQWVVLAAVLSLIVATTDELRRYVRRRLEDEIQLRVDCRLIRHVADLDVSTLENTATQDALQRATLHPGRTVLAILLGIVEFVSCAFQTLTYLVVLLWIEPLWSLLLLVAGLPHLATRWSVARASHQTVRSRTTANRWGAYYRGILRNHRIVPELKVMRLPPLLTKRFETSVTTVLKASRRIYRRQAVCHIVSTGISVVVVLLVLCLVGRQAMTGDIALGSFVAYWTAVWRMRGVIGRLSDAVSMLLDGHFEIVNMREVLDLPVTNPAGGGLRKRMQGRIELRNVTFRYPLAGGPAIDDVSAVIQPGECVALVGPNGAGKTTLAKLMARLYEPSEGAVLIDGRDLREWELDDLHRQMSVIFQEPAQIEATVGENIAFGDWERLLEHPELVRQIAQRTDFHSTVQRLPDAYRTHVGRHFGTLDLSGGQWRQLAITRGLANDPVLIILDEPTANLDVYAEERFFRSIRTLLRGRTSVLISHRFSTLRHADRLIVLDGGRIIEQGSHEELTRKNGLYASMYRSFTSQLTSNVGPPRSKAA